MTTGLHEVGYVSSGSCPGLAFHYSLGQTLLSFERYAHNDMYLMLSDHPTLRVQSRFRPPGYLKHSIGQKENRPRAQRPIGLSLSASYNLPVLAHATEHSVPLNPLCNTLRPVFIFFFRCFIFDSSPHQQQAAHPSFPRSAFPSLSEPSRCPPYTLSSLSGGADVITARPGLESP